MTVPSILLALAVVATPPTDTIRIGASLALPTLTVGVDTIDNYVVDGGQKRRSVTFVQTISDVPEGYPIVQ